MNNMETIAMVVGGILSLLSLIIAVVLMTATLKRDTKKETSSNVAEITAVIVKLESIGQGVNDLRVEIGQVRDSVQKNWERMIVIEQSARAAHARIDELIYGKKFGTKDTHSEVFFTDQK